MRIIDIIDTNDLFKNSSIKQNGFETIITSNGVSSTALSKFNIIHKLSISYFPESVKNIALKIKEFCRSEMLLSIQIDENIIIDTYNGLPITSRPTLFDLILKYNKFPAHKFLADSNINIITELNNASKLRALVRYFSNIGKVFYSHLIETNTIENELTGTVHSYSYMNESLLADGILRKGQVSDLPLILNFKTKEELLEILTKNNIQIKYSAKPKKKLIEILLTEPKLYEIDLPSQFFLLEDSYQELKMWVEKENVYKRIYYMITDRIEQSHILMPIVLKELIERNKDYETALNIINLFLSNQKIFIGINQFTIEKLKTQFKKIEKKSKQ